VRQEELLPDVFEEVEYEELTPEAEMELKRHLIAQGIQEKPLKIEWSTRNPHFG
jgi:hypothetical protein